MLMGAALPLAAQSAASSSPQVPVEAPRQPPPAVSQNSATSAAAATEPQVQARAQAAESPQTKSAPYDVVWSQPLDLGAQRDLALTRSTLVIGGAGAPLEGRALADGEPVWTWGDAVSDGPLAVAEDAIFAVVGGHVVRVDPGTGAIRWRGADNVASPHLVALGEAVVVASGVDVQSLDAASGASRWRQQLPAPVTVMAAGAASVVVGLEDHSLAMLDRASGSLLWQGHLDFAPTGVAASADRVYAVAEGGWLCGFKPPSESRDWCWHVRVPAVGVPAIGAEHVYVAYLDNTVRAFDRKNGALRATPGLPDRPASGARMAGPLLAVPLVTGDVAFLDPAARLGVTIARSPDEGLLPLLQAAALSPDGTKLALLTADPAGRTLALLARRQRAPAESPDSAPSPEELPASAPSAAESPASAPAPADGPAGDAPPVDGPPSSGPP